MSAVRSQDPTMDTQQPPGYQGHQLKVCHSQAQETKQSSADFPQALG